MTATLTNADGSKRIVLDGEIVVGAGLDYGPLPDGKAWLDATGGAGAGMGGYPAAFFLALENATGLLGIEHIEPGGEHGVLYVSSGLPTWGLIMDANVSAVAAIDFSKIDSPTTLAGYGITDAASDAELAAHEADTSAVHGIADTADLALISGLAAAAYSIDASVIFGTASLDRLDTAELNVGADISLSVSGGLNMASLANTTVPIVAAAGSPTCTNLDADKLGGQLGSYYTNADNLNAGTVGLAQGGTNADNSSQAANLVFASPASGGSGAMSLRALDPADIPSLTAAKISDFAEAVDDRVSVLVVGGTNISATYNDPAGTHTIAITGTLAKTNQNAQTAYLDGTSPFSTTQTVPTLIVNGAAGTSRDVIWRTSGVSRWLFRVNGTAEGGSNAGSDVEIQSRDDTGALVGVAIGIKRSDMTVTLAGPLVAQSTLVLTGTATLNGTLKHNGSTLGFYGVTAVARPAAITQTYASTSTTHSNLTATALTAASGTADGTVDDVGAAFNQTTLNNNFKEVATQSNSLRTDLTNVKQVINYVIDCLQSQGLLQ